MLMLLDLLIKEHMNRITEKENSDSSNMGREPLELEKAIIRQRINLSRLNGVHLNLPYLSQLVQLTELEEMALMIALAPELDSKFGNLYAQLQEPGYQTKPTVELATRLLSIFQGGCLFAQSIFDANTKLMNYRLLRFTDPGNANYLLQRSLYVDTQIVNFLIGIDQLDSRLAAVAHVADPQSETETNCFNDDHQRRLLKLVRAQLTNDGQLTSKLLFDLFGAAGSGKLSTVKAVCRELGVSLIIGNIANMLHQPAAFADNLFLLCREVLLHPAALCLLHTDALLSSPNQYPKEIAALLDSIERFPNLTFMIGLKSCSSLLIRGDSMCFQVEFTLPDVKERKNLWERMSKQVRLEVPIDFESLAEKFRFSPGRIQHALLAARSMALWRDPQHGRISMKDLQDACYLQTNHDHEHRLADKLTSTGKLEDLILTPEQAASLQELIDQVKYRRVVHGEWGFQHRLARGRGLNILLHGPPGTGKTTAAEVLANELGLDLYRIDLSQVVSKYIGETEKNLHRIFQEAEESFAILFFDEADALFGKRTEVKDALDRHANMEIAFLLQKMEEYDGITILATNLYGNLDAAFIRRMQFSIELTLPDESNRLNIWRMMFPKEAPLSDDIDYAFLAKNFKMAGGHIKNVVLSAAFLAAKDEEPIGMAHIVRSLRRELDKMGKLTSKEAFGPYFDLLGGKRA